MDGCTAGWDVQAAANLTRLNGITEQGVTTSFADAGTLTRLRNCFDGAPDTFNIDGTQAVTGAGDTDFSTITGIDFPAMGANGVREFQIEFDSEVIAGTPGGFLRLYIGPTGDKTDTLIEN